MEWNGWKEHIKHNNVHCYGDSLGLIGLIWKIGVDPDEHH